MKIKVEPFLMKKGNRLAKAAIEFESSDGALAGFHLVGFTICEDAQKGIFVLFPSAKTTNESTGDTRNFFFLRPAKDAKNEAGSDKSGSLEHLETAILDVYDSMVAKG